MMTESEKEARKRRVKKLYELNALKQKLDAVEAKVKKSGLILENPKSLFPTWSLERIQKEVVGLYMYVIE